MCSKDFKEDKERVGNLERLRRQLKRQQNHGIDIRKSWIDT